MFRVSYLWLRQYGLPFSVLSDSRSQSPTDHHSRSKPALRHDSEPVSVTIQSHSLSVTLIFIIIYPPFRFLRFCTLPIALVSHTLATYPAHHILPYFSVLTTPDNRRRWLSKLLVTWRTVPLTYAAHRSLGLFLSALCFRHLWNAQFVGIAECKSTVGKKTC
jgi:hypothetical protein